jgi:hypothetical protein
MYSSQPVLVEAKIRCVEWPTIEQTDSLLVDQILDTLLVFLVALVARNVDTLLELANQEPTYTSEASSNKGKEKSTDTLISILFFILKNSADLDPLAMISPLRSASDLEFKQNGFSKRDKIMVRPSTFAWTSKLSPLSVINYIFNDIH